MTGNNNVNNTANYCVISVGPGEERVLSFRAGKAVDFLVKRLDKKAPKRHEVYLAKVEQWSPAMNGVFMSLGEGGKAFMPTPSGSSLKLGGLYPVTVTRAAMGDKTVRVSMDIVFPSARLLFIPNKKGVHLSHRAKIKAGQAGQLLLHRLRYENVDNVLVRESAFQFSSDVLVHEAKFLYQKWRALNEEIRLKKEPGLLKYGSDALDWLIADMLAVGDIKVGNDKNFNDIKAVWQQICPDLVSHITSIGSLQADALVDEQLDHILRPSVPFGTVGELIFEHTQALTAIDVNAFTGHKRGHRHELNINLQAVPEIARHIRLRNIGGPIVIDFISMPDDGTNTLETEMNKAFADDPAETTILPLSRLGMMEMTRERSGASMAEIFLEKPAEMYLSFETVTLNLMRILMRLVREHPAKRMMIVCHPDYLEWLKHRPLCDNFIPENVMALLGWKSDTNAERRSPYITIAGVSEPIIV